MINYNEIVRLKKLAECSKNDRLIAFTAVPEMEQLDALLKSNLQLLFKEARKFKLRYLYIHKSELVGCEGKLQPGSPWPAIWAITKNIGFPGSCGNSDQYQCCWKEMVFPEDAYGGWDLKKNIKLSDEETDKMKFPRVASRRTP